MEARFGVAQKDTGPAGSNGFWILRNPAATTTHHQQQKRTVENWHALVEAETNPPYQPFHTDRRISLFAYPEPDTAPPKSPKKDAGVEEFEEYERQRDEWQFNALGPWLSGMHYVDTDLCIDAVEPWVFGREIPAVKMLSGGLGRGSGGGAGDSLTDDEDDGVENKIRVVEGEDREQLVVTSVRRRGREAEEFFEDGCEVLDFADDRV
jgi:hypothetical protein